MLFVVAKEDDLLCDGRSSDFDERRSGLWRAQ
jgi:hypothetical protein